MESRSGTSVLEGGENVIAIAKALLEKDDSEEGALAVIRLPGQMYDFGLLGPHLGRISVGELGFEPVGQLLARASNADRTGPEWWSTYITIARPSRVRRHSRQSTAVHESR